MTRVLFVQRQPTLSDPGTRYKLHPMPIERASEDRDNRSKETPDEATNLHQFQVFGKHGFAKQKRDMIKPLMQASSLIARRWLKLSATNRLAPSATKHRSKRFFPETHLNTLSKPWLYAMKTHMSVFQMPQWCKPLWASTKHPGELQNFNTSATCKYIW